jgi:hypothetical protein
VQSKNQHLSNVESKDIDCIDIGMLGSGFGRLHTSSKSGRLKSNRKRGKIVGTRSCKPGNKQKEKSNQNEFKKKNNRIVDPKMKHTRKL